MYGNNKPEKRKRNGKSCACHWPNISKAITADCKWDRRENGGGQTLIERGEFLIPQQWRNVSPLCIFVFFFGLVSALFFRIQHQHNRGRKCREEEEEDATTSSALINRCAGVATRQLLGVINVGILEGKNEHIKNQRANQRHTKHSICAS
jgi:hypothetical protein